MNQFNLKNLFFLTATLLLVFISNSCNKESQAELDEQAIMNYLSSHSLTAEKHSSGLYYIIDIEGYGNHPSKYATVKIHYKGMLTDETIFDETNLSDPLWIELTLVIEGWKTGIPLFKKGGSGTLLIPSSLGYGRRAQSDIPANSVLIFEIQLLDIDEPIN